MDMTPEVFQQIASGVQSIAVALAMVVGGTWGVYEFVVRRADRKADEEAEVELRRAEVKGTLELTVRPGVESGTMANRCSTYVRKYRGSEHGNPLGARTLAGGLGEAGQFCQERAHLEAGRCHRGP